MINDDLMRSYKQYKKQLEIGHLKINFLQKIFLSLLFFVLVPMFILKLFYFKAQDNYKLFIFPFGNKEPMKSIVDELKKIDNSEVILHPKSMYVFPLLLINDFVYTLFMQPLWTLKNLDFFGALSLKISKYYGYKVKYGISKLFLFQEYSFYSSYLTRIFEHEKGKVYNLMHGIPGNEASYFRFTKCFVWSDYFKNYYIQNNADEKQFIIVGSIFHSKLYKTCNSINYTQKYDILYAMQGDTYGDSEYVRDTFQILESLNKNKKIKIAIKRHPIYNNKIDIPSCFDVINETPQKAIVESQLILSHFSTILLDAKVMDKNVLAFLPKKEMHLVNYLNSKEIVFYKKDLYNAILILLNEKATSFLDIVNLELNTTSIIEREIFR